MGGHRCPPGGLIILRHQHGRHRAVGFGDDPEASFAGAVDRQQPVAVLQGVLVLLGVFRADIAPVAGGRGGKGPAARRPGRAGLGVGGDDDLPEREFRSMRLR